MTTITIKKKTKLSKTSFVDVEELLEDYRNMCLAEWDYIDLVALSEDEVTDTMKKKVEETKKLPPSAFTNL